MQVRHPYEYSEYGTKNGWRKEGKKLSRDWVYVWALKNPKTGKIALVMSDCESGAPTRVEPIETWYNRDRQKWLQEEHVPDPPDDGEKWRLLSDLIDSGQIRMTEKNYGVINSARLNVLLEQLRDD